MTDQAPSSITTPTPSAERTGVQAPAQQVLGWLRVWLEIEPGAPWWMWLWRFFVPVSYTHLTLPTIYSV